MMYSIALFWAGVEGTLEPPVQEPSRQYAFWPYPSVAARSSRFFLHAPFAQRRAILRLLASRTPVTFDDLLIVYLLVFV
jgi:hypothetical protein